MVEGACQAPCPGGGLAPPSRRRGGARHVRVKGDAPGRCSCARPALARDPVLSFRVIVWRCRACSTVAGRPRRVSLLGSRTGVRFACSSSRQQQAAAAAAAAATAAAAGCRHGSSGSRRQCHGSGRERRAARQRHERPGRRSEQRRDASGASGDGCNGTGGSSEQRHRAIGASGDGPWPPRDGHPVSFCSR